MRNLTATGWYKQFKSVLIAGSGAFLTVVAQSLTGLDFGPWTPAVVAALSVLVNVARVWLQERDASEG